MGFNNPDIPWRELEARLSGRSAATDHEEAPFSRKRPMYEAPRIARPDHVTAYAELHAHSNFSFLDGASHPETLVEEAVRLGLHALALTDHDGFAGAARFAEAADTHGLRTVHGTELTLELTRPQGGIADPEGRHLLVLARDVEGYHALSKAITEANLRGEEKGAPRYDIDELVDLGRDRWLVLTGCRKGFATREDIAWLVDRFGAQNVVVELTDRRLPTDTVRNDALAQLASEFGLSTVATGNVHAARPADTRLAHAFAAVRARRSLAEVDGWLPPIPFLRSGEEMARLFARYPGAVTRSVQIADEIAFDLRKASPKLPDVKIQPGHTPMSWLRELVRRGADDRYAHCRGDVEKRLQHELGVIEKKGFAGYFLIVHDIVVEARRRGILCQGRGSAASSAVCYALYITAIDPIFYGLPFERFLSTNRNEEPDIDVDFDSDRREEIIQWVYEHYGRRNAAQVANVISYRPRSAVRDMAKALGFSPGQQDAWSKQIDSWRHIESDGHDLPTAVVELAEQALTAPRHLGIHSGGMVLTQRPVGEVVPIERARMANRTVLQWDKDDCAYMGLVKFDLLGLGMLGAIQHTFDLVAEHTGERWDLGSLPKEEPAVYDMLCLADSVGVFQVESRAQIGTLPRLKPRRFYDLAIEIALIRPGPIQGGSVHPYIRRRMHPETVDYPHPKLRPVLERTLGVPLFQEQLMQIAMAVGGCTGDDADQLRRAMGSKRGVERIDDLRAKLYAGMADNGITGDVADAIYGRIQSFADFGFAESHALSFALLVYASSWLKLHHPAAFLAGLLRAQPMGFYSPQSLVADARRHGVEVRRPDIMHSGVDVSLESAVGATGGTGLDACLKLHHEPDLTFRPRPALAEELLTHRRDGHHAVRLGLSSVVGIGRSDAERIVAARHEVPFTSMADVARRTGLTTTQLEALSTAGAFDSLGLTRREALWNAGFTDGPDLLAGTAPHSGAAVTPALPGMSDVDLLLADFAATRITPGQHPLEFVREELAARGILSVAEAEAHEADRRVRVGGLITHRQRPSTAAGVTFLNLEDETGMLNVVVFESVWKRHRRVARTVAGVVVRGMLERQDGATNLIAETIEPLASRAIPARHRSRDFR